jgi:hypothetical protein
MPDPSVTFTVIKTAENAGDFSQRAAAANLIKQRQEWV